MFSGLKSAFIQGVNKGKKWFRARVNTAASAVHTYNKYAEHSHQIVKGVKHEVGRAKHQLNKAAIEGKREAIVYHTEKRTEYFRKKHPINNKKVLTIKTKAIHKREQEVRDAKKAKLKAAAELKKKLLYEEKLRKEKALRMAALKRRKVTKPKKSEISKVNRAEKDEMKAILKPKKVKRPSKASFWWMGA
jgi:hypothetical protein